MKKYYSALPLLVLAAALLGGCACKHQWEDAFCVRAQVCSHCGQIQGTAQDNHSFTEWKTEENQMIRTCMFCGFHETEATPFPSEVTPQPTETESQYAEIIPQQTETEPQVMESAPQSVQTEPQTVPTGQYMTDISGHWISTWIELDDVMQSCYRLTTEYTLDIFPDGTYQACLEGNTINNKWAYIDSSESPTTLSYDIYSGDKDYTYAKGSFHSDFTFLIYSNGDLQFTDNNYVRYSFRRMNETVAAELENSAEIARKAAAGTWVSYLLERQTSDGQITIEPDTSYSVTFHADGSIYHSMPEWGKEHIVETSWHIAELQPQPHCAVAQIDFLDEDTQIPKHFFFYNFNSPSKKYMRLAIGGQGSMRYYYLKPADR